MKKILVLSGLITLLLLNSFVFESDVLAEQTQLKVTDVKVYSDDGKFGLQDKQGNIVVKAEYKKLIRVGNSSWIVQKKNRFGLMDTNGDFLVQPKYRHVERVFGKFVKFGNDNDYGLYDETGKIIIPHEYSSIEPLFGKTFLTCKKYKYGVVDENGKLLLDNEFDDIYMPRRDAMRVRYKGEWFELERVSPNDIQLPDGVTKVVINDEEIKITHLLMNTGVMSGYSATTAADYTLKILSSISPAYEQTIDDLMLSQGVDTVSIFMKLGWIPKFPYTYAKKYYQNLVNPNNGPLFEVKSKLKSKISRQPAAIAAPD